MQEGAENDKLQHHPTDAKSYWAYKVIHNPVYYITECIVCMLLMLLVFLEWPAFFENIPSRVSLLCSFVRHAYVHKYMHLCVAAYIRSYVYAHTLPNQVTLHACIDSYVHVYTYILMFNYMLVLLFADHICV